MIEAYSWEEYRLKARSLWFFETAILSDAWPKDDKFHDFGRIQHWMCDFLQDKRYRKKYLSAFRLSFKTTVLMGYYAWLFCWYLAQGRSTKMIYDTYTKENAWNFSSDLRFTVKEGELLHWVFPELNKGILDVDTKNRIQHKHVRTDFASLDTTLVTRHYPIWCNDDLENDQNIKTETLREGLKSQWQYQKAVLTKLKKKGVGMEVDVGTPYHYQGLNWSIRNNPTYKKLIIPYKDKSGNLTFPELYTEEDFEEKFADLDRGIVSSQFELCPISELDALCKPSWIRERWEKLPEYRWRTFVIDPGGSDPKDHDATGITICDTDSLGKMYVVYAEEHWVTPTKLMELIIELQNTYKPDDLRIEKEKYAITIADIFEHRYPLMNISFVRHEKRKKQIRIWRLKQWLEKQMIILGKGQKKLEDQLLQYQGEGSIRLDDLIDSLSYHLDIRKVPEVLKPHLLPSGTEFEPQVDESFRQEYAKYLESIKYREREDIEYCDKIY